MLGGTKSARLLYTAGRIRTEGQIVEEGAGQVGALSPEEISEQSIEIARSLHGLRRMDAETILSLARTFLGHSVDYSETVSVPTRAGG